MTNRASLVAVGVSVAVSAACSSSGDAAVAEQTDGGTSATSSSGNEDTGAASTSSSTSSSSSSSSGGNDAATTSADDPRKEGPYTAAEASASVPSGANNDALTLRVIYPAAGPAAGPYPVVFFAPGYQVDVSAYAPYGTRLATHGIVTVLVSFSQAATNQARDGKNLEAALAWAASPGAMLAGKIDAARAGVSGHSRGGKAAVLAAAANTGFKALLALDPVDSKPPLPCSATNCPDGSDASAQFKVPSAYLGETLDGTAGFGGQACAPAADNYTTFYASSPAPSLEVTVNGAGHMSFVADVDQCGFACNFCKDGTRPGDEVVAIASAYLTSFFRRHLKNETAYDAYLTGTEAQARWVTPGAIALRSK